MSELKLNVSFNEKEVVKSLGARWNPQERTWFVPNGMDPRPFVRWIHESQLLSYEEQLVDIEESSLTEYLSRLSVAISSIGKDLIWVKTEISHILKHKKGHIYLELVDRDKHGMLLYKSSAVIWKTGAKKIIEKFKKFTGSELVADIKVMLQVRARLDLIYGLKLIIEDIDPVYTLGDMATKLKEIRTKLQKEKIIANNKKLILPKDYNNVAVIAPANAAGLGDFDNEAKLLHKYNLCSFSYFYAQFQGVDAPTEITQALLKIQAEHKKHAFEVIVIIRGGGATTDLAWLNDYELAKKICLANLPVFTGIGHNRDITILDEIACRSFDTPSKVSAHIYGTIVERVQAMEMNANFIFQYIDNKYYQHVKIVESVYFQVWKDSYKLISNKYKMIDSLNIHNKQLANTVYLRTISSIDCQVSDIKVLVNKKIDYVANDIAQELQKNIYNKIAKTVVKTYEEIEKKTPKIYKLFIQIIKNQKNAIENTMKQIIGYGPRATLSRGYVLAKNKLGNAIISKKRAIENNVIILEFNDGELSVTNEERGNNGKSKKRSNKL